MTLVHTFVERPATLRSAFRAARICPQRQRPKSGSSSSVLRYGDAAARGKITLVFKPGPYTEQVVVEADATTLRIGNSAVGSVFDSETLQTLPVPEREPERGVRQAALNRGHPPSTTREVHEGAARDM